MTYGGSERRQGRALSFLADLSFEELLEYARSRSVDQRTGLLVLDAFKDALHRRPEEEFPATLLILDIVGLKALNTTSRYLGDKAIAEAGRIVRQQSTENDLATRLGGDEFGVYLPGAREHAARTLVDRIAKDVHESNMLVRRDPHFEHYVLEVRYGIVSLPDATSERIDAVIDTALHKAYQGVPVTPRY